VLPSLVPDCCQPQDKKQHLIKAHESALSALAINLTATRVASASTQATLPTLAVPCDWVHLQGTLVRVFDAKNGTQLHELRRGMDPADICSVSFSASAQWLAAASDKGTVHVFSLESSAEGASGAENPKSSFSFLSNVLPKYFDSEWSFAQFQLPPGARYCAFGGHDDPAAPTVTLYVVGMDGMFYKGEFDKRDGGQSVLRVKEAMFS
jgi:WD40 repeat protein